MITIRDLIIAPFEIDVDSKNFTVVEVSVTESGEVAGKKVEGGKQSRKTVGHYSTFMGALNRILRERVIGFAEDLDGQHVTLKQFIKRQEKEKEIFIKWVKLIAGPFSITDEDGVPVLSPRTVLANAGAAVDTEVE